MNGNKKRICIDCKKEKMLNGYVFLVISRENSSIKTFDNVCKDCRHKEANRIRNLRRKKTIQVLKKCKSRNCENEIRKIGFKYYCCDKCRLDENSLLGIERRIEERLRKKRGIPEKFLVRGKITYEGHTWNSG